MANKPSRSQRKVTRERASRGATRSSPDGIRRPVTPVPSSARGDDDAERASAAPPRPAGKRRRRERGAAGPVRSFEPVRETDPVSAPLPRSREARDQRRNRALAGFFALLAIGGLAGWFLLNRDPKPDHNMVTVDLGGPQKDTPRAGDRVDVVGAPPILRTPPDTRLQDPPVVAPPPVKAPPPASPPTSTATPAAPEPSAAPKAVKADPTSKPAAPPPPKPPKAPEGPPY